MFHRPPTWEITTPERERETERPYRLQSPVPNKLETDTGK